MSPPPAAVQSPRRLFPDGDRSCSRVELASRPHHMIGRNGPETATGLVESMRTEDDDQRRALARHVLTTGIDLLAAAEATCIKICFEPDNPASSSRYLGVGFRPVKECVMLSGRG